MNTATHPQNVTELFDDDARYVLTLKGYRAIGAEPLSIPAIEIIEELYERAERE